MNVPLCGWCHKAFVDKELFGSNENEQSEDSICLWCGSDDDRQLFMCDSLLCRNSICSPCVIRNFGIIEANRVEALPVWHCYVCQPTKSYLSLQIPEDQLLFSVDKCFSAVPPPPIVDSNIIAIADALQPQELLLLSLFTDDVNPAAILARRQAPHAVFGNTSSKAVFEFGFRDLDLSSYLTAADCWRSLMLVSKGVRQYLMASTTLLPGLFRTTSGMSRGWSLFPHQHASLRRLKALENSQTDFASLRGGLFADAPGLGKTITVLALISSTSGTMPTLPQSPAGTLSRAEANLRWTSEICNPLLRSSLLAVINLLLKESAADNVTEVNLLKIKRLVEQGCSGDGRPVFASIEDFEHAVSQALLSGGCSKHWKSVIRESFRLRMLTFREELDRKSRYLVKSVHGRRLRFERMLRPSGATLILAPLVLLEHWFEQIRRHLNLAYFASDDSDDAESGTGRGVVFIDGLGDVVDVCSPLPKLEVTSSFGATASQLASYLIVLSSLERCTFEHKRGRMASSEDCNQTMSPLQEIRWLRLIVDEGHELGSGKRKKPRQQTSAASSSATSAPASHAESPSPTSLSASPSPDQADLATTTTTTTTTTATTIATTSAAASSSFPGQGFDHTAAARLLEDRRALAAVFINGIAAERRWVMTGTPTRGTSSGLALDQLYRLLMFLRHPTYARFEEDDSSACQIAWSKDIVAPFLARTAAGWQMLLTMLTEIVVKHSKEQLRLHAPNRSAVLLEPLVEPLFPSDAVPSASENEFVGADNKRRRSKGQSRSVEEELDAIQAKTMDRTKGSYIAAVMAEATAAWKRANRLRSSRRVSSGATDAIPGAVRWQLPRVIQGTGLASVNSSSDSRRPKAIVFSMHEEDLQGVGHYLYNLLGDSALCEHWGTFRSSELGRFRHSQSRCCTCPLCGFQNGIGSGDHCAQTLLLVRYDAIEMETRFPATAIMSDADAADYEPCPAGHGDLGPGGSYRGRCYCSATGCSPSMPCPGFKNALASHSRLGPHFALVSQEHVVGWRPGYHWQINERVRIRNVSTQDESPGILWRGGVLGGTATVCAWKACGGRHGWHGDKTLRGVPWRVTEEDASILLLSIDGSAGLDLSFATHIFMLERLHDPALENQLISRAHRMGATGPATVQIVSVAL